MKLITCLLIWTIANIAYATENIEIEIFSRVLQLEGDCKYVPTAANTALFSCRNKESTYTASVKHLVPSEATADQMFIDPKMAENWKIKIRGTNSQNIDDLLHLRSIATAYDNSIKSDQYHICDDNLCITFTADNFEVYEDVIHQISSKYIKVDEIEADF